MSSVTSKATRAVAGPLRVTLGLVKHMPVPYFVGRARTAMLRAILPVAALAVLTTSVGALAPATLAMVRRGSMRKRPGSTKSCLEPGTGLVTWV